MWPATHLHSCHTVRAHHLFAKLKWKALQAVTTLHWRPTAAHPRRHTRATHARSGRAGSRHSTR